MGEKAKWINRKELNKEDVISCAKEYGCSNEIATILLKRGLDFNDFTSFVEHSPYLLKDIEAGVEIICDAIRNQERIVVVNDYDVDGATSGYIMFEGIRKCGGVVSVISPDRIIDGYGISNRIIDRAKEMGARLLVTTDNGISAKEQIDYAKSLGMKVVVTDHHEIPFVENEDNTYSYILPNADAIINPKQEDDEYPYKEICGALVAFKVISLILPEFIYDDDKLTFLLDRYRELVCLGTICDVMPLENENRTFVKDGLRLLKNSSFQGIKSLIKALGIDDENKINSFFIGFQIGPCINSISRMTGSVKTALQLFQTEDKIKADELALSIVSLNEERKELCREYEETIKEFIEKKEDNILVIYIPNGNPALMGIVAGNIVEETNKPCICLTDDERNEGIIKGSGRSIEGYDMFDSLSKHKVLFERFGGHKGAIGVSLKKENLETLKESLNMDAERINKEIFEKNILVDLYMDMDKVEIPLIKEIEELEPFGEKNPTVIMCQENVKLTGIKRMGKDGQYARLIFENSNNGHYEEVMFNNVDNLDSMIKDKYSEQVLTALYDIGRLTSEYVNMSVLYKASINTYKGNSKPQCIINDFML